MLHYKTQSRQEFSPCVSPPGTILATRLSWETILLYLVWYGARCRSADLQMKSCTVQICSSISVAKVVRPSCKSYTIFSLFLNINR